MYRPIKDYAVIGDTHTAALISAHGSLDWACLPHFNSSAMFLRLLDDERGGYCAIEAGEVNSRSRRYLPDTNILETTFTTSSGVLQVTDFMPLRRRPEPTQAGQDVDSDHQIVRLLRCRSGHVEAAIELRPSLDFAREKGKFEKRDGSLVFCGARDELHIQGAKLEIRGDEKAVSHVRLNAGEAAFIGLRHARPGTVAAPMDLPRAEALLGETREYWQNWAQTCQYQGPYRDSVVRSALTSKLLT
ncbi:MAG TPA: trehalase-like domain-containing protein, partial [Terriglobales bacterium]|nr:trehalase-like domain-containing protein [Terriglobales bacterium]